MHSLPADDPRNSSGKFLSRSRRLSVLRLSKSSGPHGSTASSVSADDSWCASNEDHPTVTQTDSQNDVSQEAVVEAESSNAIVPDKGDQVDPELRAEIIHRKKSAVGRAIVHLEQTEARSRCPPVLRPIDRAPTSSQRLVGTVSLFERIAANAEARRIAQEVHSGKGGKGDCEIASQVSIVTSSSTNSLNASQSSTVQPLDGPPRRFYVKRTLSLAGLATSPLPALNELRM